MADSQPIRIKTEPGIWQRGKVYEITYRDAQGSQRRRKVSGGLMAARSELAKEVAQRASGERATADPRLTFGKAADQWFDGYVVPNLRTATADCYRYALKHLRKEFGSRRLTEISPSMVATYIKKREAAGMRGNSIKSHLAAMAGVYSYSRRHLGFSGQWPGADLDARERPSNDDAREPRSLTTDEIAALVKHAKADRFMYEFGLATGLRQSEILGLVWADLDLDDSPAINVIEQLGRDGKRVALKTKRSKRRVVITDAMKARLVALKLASSRSLPTDFVFVTRQGTAHDQANVGRGFARTVERAGIDPDCTFHWLRHTHGSMLIASGWNVVDVAARMGDAIETVQAIYLHEFDAAKREDDQRQRLGSLGSIVAAQKGTRGNQSETATGTDS